MPASGEIAVSLRHFRKNTIFGPVWEDHGQDTFTGNGEGLSRFFLGIVIFSYVELIIGPADMKVMEFDRLVRN